MKKEVIESLREEGRETGRKEWREWMSKREKKRKRQRRGRLGGGGGGTFKRRGKLRSVILIQITAKHILDS